MLKKFTAVLVIATLSNGCSFFSQRAPMKRFSTQEQAGTVHVAVQSIARFDDAYTDQLQPRFDLTSQAALEAISQTQVSEMERLRVLLAELTIAGQKRSVTSEKTMTKGEVTTETTTEKVDPPDFATTTAAPSEEGLTNNAPGITPDERPQLDQSLRYRAAAALIQEIALFNRYVRDAAVSRNSVPYVVRLLVTVNPSARREPYDVYTTISFFLDGEPDFQRERDRLPEYIRRGLEQQAERLKGQAADMLAAMQKREATHAEKAEVDTYAMQMRADAATLYRYVDKFKDAKATDDAFASVVPACDRSMEVIPLFVTDNLESSFNSAANERVLGGSASGTGFFANFAARLGLRGQGVDRDRSLARSINGLTTISRLSGNTVMARLGAANANNDFEMVARTYNVTLLALVPNTAALRNPNLVVADVKPDDKTKAWWPFGWEALKQLDTLTPCSDFSFTAYSKFRDAVRGAEVPTSYQARRERMVADMLKTWQLVAPNAGKPAHDAAVREMKKLLAYAETGRSQDFASAAGTAFPVFADRDTRNMLWHDLVRGSHISGRSHGRFQLPERAAHFFSEQPVTLFDDGKATVAVLNDARNLTMDGFRARIKVKNGTVPEAWVDDAGVTISPDRHRATVTFPSLRARLGDKVEVLAFEAKKIESGARGDLTTTNLMTGSPVAYQFIEEPKKPQPTKMGITADTIRLASGAGEFAVTFVSDKGSLPPAVRLEISGATINTVTPAAPFIDGGLEVPGQGNYVIALKNLFEGTPVKVRAILPDKTVIGEKTLTVKP